MHPYEFLKDYEFWIPWKDFINLSLPKRFIKWSRQIQWLKVGNSSVYGKLSKITKNFSVPLIFRLGIQKDIIGSEEDSANRLTISMDGINPIDYTVYGGVGFEYSWQNIAFIRGGTRLFHDTAGISLGGGLQWSMFIVDYAYVNYGILKETHQFGISLNF